MNHSAGEYPVEEKLLFEFRLRLTKLVLTLCAHQVDYLPSNYCGILVAECTKAIADQTQKIGE